MMTVAQEHYIEMLSQFGSDILDATLQLSVDKAHRAWDSNFTSPLLETENEMTPADSPM
jgi:hypothetical protein